MKAETFLKTTLVVLLAGLAVVVGSWMTSEFSTARAEGGGGSASGEWIVVASTLDSGNGLVYIFNTDKQVLLVYAYHRGFKSRSTGTNPFIGDLQFLAGRHCRWDVLYAQLTPFPYTTPGNPAPKDSIMPVQMKKAFETLSQAQQGE